MNALTATAAKAPVLRRATIRGHRSRYIPVLATAALFAVIYGVGVIRYPAFGYPQVFRTCS